METTTGHRVQQYFFLALLIGVAILMFFIWRPFMSSLVLAFTLSIIFMPAYTRILSYVRGREGVAAFATILLILLVVLLPLFLVGTLLFSEVVSLYNNLATNGGGIIAQGSATIQEMLQQYAPNVTVDIPSYAQTALGWLASHLDSIFSGFFRVVIGLFVMLIALYYLLKDGRRLRKSFTVFSPLSNVYDETILNKLAIAINSVVKGSLIIATLQGILAAIGTSLVGLPNPIIWGSLTTLASLIPGVGTGLVIGPAIAYLFFTGNVTQSIVLLAWQVAIVGLVDNFLSPYLLNRGMKIHPFLILLSVLGGLLFFGPIGFILGPIILALLFALLDIYPLVINTK